VIVECTFAEQKRAAGAINRQWRARRMNEAIETTLTLDEPKQPTAYEQAAVRWREKGDALIARAEEARTACYKYADGLVESHHKMEEFYKSETEYLDQVFAHITAAPKHAGNGKATGGDDPA
jgi:hypothetical protein